MTFRSSYPEVFLGKGVLKICSKFTAEHPCRMVFDFNKVALQHETLNVAYYPGIKRIF